ncbi:MAG: hypothetical protein JSW61_03200 [Candidatus Thorarchaeota archaeon]|nr:MAG: hypothetical protein JSW61_03200 [Candidatus Thorarchaeota archaeon]
MNEQNDIIVVLETTRFTTGAHDWRGTHLCDYGQCSPVGGGASSVPFSDKDGKSNRIVPPDVMPLIYSAKAAADEIGCKLIVIDIATMGFREKRRSKVTSLPIPRVQVGLEVLPGIPTKAEILELYDSATEYAEPLDSRIVEMEKLSSRHHVKRGDMKDSATVKPPKGHSSKTTGPGPVTEL